MYGKDLIIGGKHQPAQGRARFDVINPATQQVMGQAGRAAAGDVELAVQAAKQGFAVWSGLPAGGREAVLLRAGDILSRQGEERCLELLIDESGSVINKARFEINYSVDLLRTAAGEARRLYGDTFPNDSPERLSMVLREPLGVVAVISPFNAPLALLVKMAAFPLAAGNSIVIKPSEETPLIALEFADLLLEAGLPPAAISVLPGFGDECGAALANHTAVKGIALTGSTETGKLIGRAAMQNMTRVQLELGGKSALLVLRDSDPAQAAALAIQGMFNHAGQICMANSRMVVEAPVFDEFSQALKQGCEALSIGDVRDTDSAYGPLINRRALEKVQAHQQDALANGASLLTGGAVHSGLVYQPTVLLEPGCDSSLWREESFGPIASLVCADNLDHAISLANDTDYGLSAAVLTHNIQWGFKAAKEIRSGAVHIGMHAFQSNALAPVGGVGLSGIGRSGGKFSIEHFTELKWVSIELGGAD
ncbi:MAG: aldehyde dehydrogenase family protein [Halieaceae bacterium]|nr:aldehyde dehydrogenase family protein [Halieaceae bacterium]